MSLGNRLASVALIGLVVNGCSGGTDSTSAPMGSSSTLSSATYENGDFAGEGSGHGASGSTSATNSGEAPDQGVGPVSSRLAAKLSEDALPEGATITHREEGVGSTLFESTGTGIAILCQGVRDSDSFSVEVNGEWYGEGGCGDFVAALSGEDLQPGSKVRLKLAQRTEWALVFFG